MLPQDLEKALRKGECEKTPQGIYFPKENMLASGVFRYNIRGEEEETSTNLVVDEALDYLLGASFGVTTPLSLWYVAVFSGDVTVLSSWTAANFSAQSTEWTNYVSATRPEWQKGVIASGGIDSFAAKAEFESTTDAQTIRGAALISNSSKGSTNGTLIAASRFPSDKALDTGEILDVGYGLQLTAV